MYKAKSGVSDLLEGERYKGGTLVVYEGQKEVAEGRIKNFIAEGSLVSILTDNDYAFLHTRRPDNLHVEKLPGDILFLSTDEGRSYSLIPKPGRNTFQEYLEAKGISEEKYRSLWPFLGKLSQLTNSIISLEKKYD